MKRYWVDSEGNRGRIILFSELPDYVTDELQPKEKLHRMPQTILKKKHLNCLTEKQLKVIIMRFWGKMEVKKIAKRLKTTVQAVYERLWRAYEKLRIEINV